MTRPDPVRVKICCIASHSEAEMAIAAGADALGLVAAMPSGPGPISDEAIADITSKIPPTVATFLLTSRTTAETISAHITATGPSAVQIVAPIDVAEAAELAKLQPATRRVKVVHVEDHSAIDEIALYGPHVHAFLLDSGRPSAATPQLGGTGRAHDWSISRVFVEQSPLPVFLAGGLNSSNVGEAIEMVRPYGVDLCSGVRTNGALDEAKLTDFMAAVGV